MAWQEIWESFLDIIYPTNIRCSICNSKRDDILSYGVCELCESRLPFIKPPTCPKCGKTMLDYNITCSDCVELNHAFYKGMSIFEFSTEVKGLIYRYKYGREKYLSIPMIHWMTKGLKLYQWDFEAIVPVPLHPARERQRGFNQAALLARGLSSTMGMPIIEKSLMRIKNTPHQTKLDRYERRQNLKGAFGIRRLKVNPEVFKDKSILLVDDVYTTGSTADQCAKVLLENGARMVYVITLATGSNF